MQKIKGAYFYFVTLPDRLYPFACEIEGKLVRGRQAYEKAVADAFEKYGPNRLSYQLLVYRGTFHFFGSIVFMVLAILVAKDLFGSDIALYVLLGAAIISLSIQEFYVHPRRYGQLTQKGIADWATWVLPMAAYLFFFCKLKTENRTTGSSSLNDFPLCGACNISNLHIFIFLIG